MLVHHAVQRRLGAPLQVEPTTACPTGRCTLVEALKARTEKAEKREGRVGGGKTAEGSVDERVEAGGIERLGKAVGHSYYEKGVLCT